MLASTHRGNFWNSIKLSNIMATKMLNGTSTEQLMSLQKILIILEKKRKKREIMISKYKEKDKE